MKKIIIILFALFTQIVFVFNLYSFNPSVEYRVLNINFNGVCSNSKSIIAYGDYTNILVSQDKGESWVQKSIFSNIKSNFNKIIVSNDVFYGLIDSIYIIKSIDGMKWTVYRSPTPGMVVDISVDSNNIYLLPSERNKIYVLNREIKLVDSIEVSIGITEIFSYKDNTYIGTVFGRFYVYNSKAGSNLQMYDLTSLGRNIFDFQSDGDNIYFRVDSSLFVLNNLNQNVSLVLKNAPYIFRVRNGEVYSVNFMLNSLYGLIYKWISFEKYDKDNGSFVRLNNDRVDRFIEDLNSFLPYRAFFAFIDDERIVLVSSNKTILLSENGGKNWKLKSYLISSLNIDGCYVFKNYLWIPVNKTLFRSSDFGATWLPQKADSLFIVSRFPIITLRYLFFDTNGKGIIVNWMEYIYSDTTRNFEILYSEDFGENYRVKPDKKIPYYFQRWDRAYSQILRFKDKYVFKHIFQFNIFNKKYGAYSVLDFYDTTFNYLGPRVFNDTVIYSIFFLDNKDTLYALFTWLDTTISYKEQIVQWWISYSVDGQNWQKLFDAFISKYHPSIYLTPKGPLVFFSGRLDSTKYLVSIDLYDVRKQKGIRLLEKNISIDEFDFKNKSVYKFFYPLQDKLLYCDYLDSIVYVYDLSKDTPSTWERTNIFDVLFNSIGFYSTIWFPLQYYLLNPNDSFFFFRFDPNALLLRADFTSDTSISFVNDWDYDGQDFIDRVFIKTLPPFPQPANSFVKAKIYIEGFREISPDYFEIYDMQGNKVTNQTRINVEKLTPFLFEAFFDVTALPNGIYFVRYSSLDEGFSFLLMVNR